MGSIRNRIIAREKSARLGNVSRALRAAKVEVGTLRKQAETDPLTGLYNRSTAQVRFLNECSRTSRTHQGTGVLFIDIDFFKSVNDIYGHDAGDEALKHISSILHTVCREYDTPFRWGGEEFGVILPMVVLEDTKGIAERVREKIEDTTFKYKNATIPLTASIGVYVAPYDDCTTLDAAMAVADIALLEAKDTGRNRVLFISNKGQDPQIHKKGPIRSRPDGARKDSLQPVIQPV